MQTHHHLFHSLGEAFCAGTMTFSARSSDSRSAAPTDAICVLVKDLPAWICVARGWNRNRAAASVPGRYEQLLVFENLAEVGIGHLRDLGARDRLAVLDGGSEGLERFEGQCLVEASERSRNRGGGSIQVVGLLVRNQYVGQRLGSPFDLSPRNASSTDCGATGGIAAPVALEGT